LATLNDIKIDRPIEFIAYKNDGNIHSSYIENNGQLLEVTLNEACTKEFVEHLSKTKNKVLVEETLQGLAIRSDGTPLKTAFPTFNEFKKAIENIDRSMFKELINALPEWELCGCNEVVINFEEKLRQN